jgi:hypothetical protein
MRRSAKFILLAAALMATPVLADDPPPSGSDTPTESTWRRKGALLDRSPQRRSNMLSLFVGLPYGYFYYGFPFGIGGRFLIPLVHDGFIPALNDSFSIEFGLDLTGAAGFGRFYPTLGIPVEVMWAFHLTEKFAAYAKLGAVLEINFVPYVCSGGFCGPARGVVSASPIGNVGIIYKFSQSVSFRAEAGYPWVKIGLGFDM